MRTMRVLAGRTHNEKKMLVALYCRVSTGEQDTGAQEAELRRYAEVRGWTIFKIYRDKGYSGATTNRPALQELLSDTRRRRFDAILVFRFDRFARSLRELLNALELCRQANISVVSATEGIDTGSASGELIFHIFGAIAQFERSLIGARVRSGLQHAREQGKQIGRPAEKLLTEEEQRRVVRDRLRKRSSLRKLAKNYGTTVWQVSRALARRKAVWKEHVSH